MSNLIPRIEFFLQSLLREQATCPHCKAPECITVARKYVSIRIKKCEICHLYFTSPIYRPLLFSNLYDYVYTGTGYTTQLPSEDELVRLKDSCFRSSEKHFGDRISIIRTLCQNQDNDPLRLLEIGSSWGYFLFQAQRQGFGAVGVEISEPRRKFGIGKLDVNMVANIDDLRGQKFDVVYSAHTLEHFTDLSTIFMDVNHLLRSGGVFVIEVPNFDFETMGDQVLPIIGAVHPLGFSKGFFEQNFPSYRFKIRGFYDSWLSVSKQSPAHHLGDTIILVAEKCSVLA